MVKSSVDMEDILIVDFMFEFFCCMKCVFKFDKCFVFIGNLIVIVNYFFVCF